MQQKGLLVLIILSCATGTKHALLLLGGVMNQSNLFARNIGLISYLYPGNMNSFRNGD
mgnify:CR=1 FL=1